MIVVVERPERRFSGGAVAAPMLSRSHVLRLAPLQHRRNGTYQKPLKGSGASISSDVDVMQLGDILDDLTLDVARGSLEITHVDIDSRECVPGLALFARCPAVDERCALRLRRRRTRRALRDRECSR